MVAVRKGIGLYYCHELHGRYLQSPQVYSANRRLFSVVIITSIPDATCILDTHTEL